MHGTAGHEKGCLASRWARGRRGSRPSGMGAGQVDLEFDDVCRAVVLAPSHFSWSGLAVFSALSYPTLLLGHSIGMHRRLIHRTFECPKAFERLLVWLGVLVGMVGPFGILRIHDIRDWAQRESKCHDFF